METIKLADYNIHVGDIWDAFNTFLKEKAYQKIIVIVDDNTALHCLPILNNQTQRNDFHIIQIPAGEIHKNIATCRIIWQQMMDLEADRNALTINLGGGVIGDMGGFCASTFKRGMDFVQMPTTLLSQVDASIGGKLGIDFMQIKNSIGLFNNPKAIFIDPIFLKTLSPREIRSGFAEIVKHSLIADQEQWYELQQIDNFEQVNWAQLLIPSLLIKKKIVEIDPFEKDLRKALNFGHTIGHAIEGLTLKTDQRLLHGEAIAIGMICETYLSQRRLNLPLKDAEQISEFILRVYGKPTITSSDYSNFIELMKNDKKNEGKQINFSLISAPGKVQVNLTCTEAEIIESLDYYQKMTT